MSSTDMVIVSSLHGPQNSFSSQALIKHDTVAKGVMLRVMKDSLLCHPCDE